MARFGLCGPAYTSQSMLVDCEDLVNWYCEIPESPGASTGVALYPCPGLKRVATAPESPIRGTVFANGRLFAVAGKRFVEYDANWNATVRNSALDIANDNRPASIAASSSQILIIAGGRAYYFLMGTNVFGEIDTITQVALQGPVSQAGYSDGYFFALLKNSQRFQISNLADVTVWDPASIGDVQFATDNIVSLFTDHREPWFFAPKQIVPYYNTGNPDFPYSPVPGAYIEDGIAAQFSPARLDNSLFWISADERGQGIGKRAQGYTPVRVSNHGVEYAWSKYPTLADAITYSYQDQGHTNWVCNFPSANNGLGATWVYDVATQWWHRRGQWNGVDYSMHPGQFHAFAFGKHIVGGLQSGNIYDMSINYVDDDGTPIRRMRRAPAIQNEDVWIYFNRLTLDVEVGLGPIPPLKDGEGNPRGPQIMLRWSNLSGKPEWSNEVMLDCGQAGAFNTQVFLDRMGRARKGRVFEISTSDPIPWRIANSYLRANPGFQPLESVAKQLQKVQ